MIVRNKFTRYISDPNFFEYLIKYRKLNLAELICLVGSRSKHLVKNKIIRLGYTEEKAKEIYNICKLGTKLIHSTDSEIINNVKLKKMSSFEILANINFRSRAEFDRYLDNLVKKNFVDANIFSNLDENDEKFKDTLFEKILNEYQIFKFSSTSSINHFIETVENTKSIKKEKLVFFESSFLKNTNITEVTKFIKENQDINFYILYSDLYLLDYEIINELIKLNLPNLEIKHYISPFKDKKMKSKSYNEENEFMDDFLVLINKFKQEYKYIYFMTYKKQLALNALSINNVFATNDLNLVLETQKICKSPDFVLIDYTILSDKEKLNTLLNSSYKSWNFVIALPILNLFDSQTFFEILNILLKHKDVDFDNSYSKVLVLNTLIINKSLQLIDTTNNKVKVVTYNEKLASIAEIFNIDVELLAKNKTCN